MEKVTEDASVYCKSVNKNANTSFPSPSQSMDLRRHINEQSQSYAYLQTPSTKEPPQECTSYRPQTLSQLEERVQPNNIYLGVKPKYKTIFK